MIIEFKLNNRNIKLNTDPGKKLSDVLRKEFGYYSVNECCNTGRCGGCTVLRNNLPVPACMISMFSVSNSEIYTYEWIEETPEFEIVSKVLDAYGCRFCDFCHNGKMITIYAFLKSNTKPEKKDILEAMSGNSCSCTDHNSMTEGIRLAASAIKRGKNGSGKK